MPLRSRLLEWTTLAGLALCGAATVEWLVTHSVSLAAVQSAIAVGLIVIRDSKLLELFARLRPAEFSIDYPHSHSSAPLAPNSEFLVMPKIYQTLAEISADLPDLVTVLQDFVAVSKLIESKDFVGIIGSYAKWEADVVKLVNDARGAAVSQETQSSLPLSQTVGVMTNAPSGSAYVPTNDMPQTPIAPSIAAQAGLPESSK